MLETFKRNFLAGLVGFPAFILGIAVGNICIKGAETVVKKLKK